MAFRTLTPEQRYALIDGTATSINSSAGHTSTALAADPESPLLPKPKVKTSFSGSGKPLVARHGRQFAHHEPSLRAQCYIAIFVSFLAIAIGTGFMIYNFLNKDS